VIDGKNRRNGEYGKMIKGKIIKGKMIRDEMIRVYVQNVSG
jgi:hypothetical protein